MVKKSERVYNSMESRTPPHACTRILIIIPHLKHVVHVKHLTQGLADCCRCATLLQICHTLCLSLSIFLLHLLYAKQFQTISNILSNLFNHLSFLSIFFAFCCCYPFCHVLNSNHRKGNGVSAHSIGQKKAHKRYVQPC